MADLIEDEDGAPLPDELQRGSAVRQATYDALEHAVTVTEASRETDAIMVALAPILAPWLPSLRDERAERAAQQCPPRGRAPHRIDVETGRCINPGCTIVSRLDHLRG